MEATIVAQLQWAAALLGAARDLAGGAKRLSAVGRGIVKGGVGVDWHDTGSSVDQEAKPGSNLLGLGWIRRAACDAARTARIAVGRLDTSDATTLRCRR